MARRRATSAEIDTALGIVERELLTAVRNTLNDEWAEPARNAVDDLLGPDGELTDAFEVPPPGEVLTQLILTAWLRDARQRTTVDAERVLDWIGERLGARFRLRARHIRGYLDGDPQEAARLAEALGDDELPAMIWLVAGTVALYGDDDVAWLTR
jgi:hypothetical protein